MHADLTGIRAAIQEAKRDSPVAAGQAINKALARIRTVASRKLAAAKGVPVNAVKKRMKVRKSNRATGGRLTVLQQRLLAPSLGKIGKAKGMAKAGKFAFPGAFVATVGSGHTSIFKRVLPSSRSSRGRAATSPNLPIKEVGIALLPEAESIVSAVIGREGHQKFADEYNRIMAIKLAK